jgi:type I restriction-modification system DNA methylase subunit
VRSGSACRKNEYASLRYGSVSLMNVYVKQNMDKKHLTVNAVADYLGVSEATVKNWIRHGYLKPLPDKTLISFDAPVVAALKEKINSGEIGRLNKRANKRDAGKSFIPEEYLNSPGDIEKIEKIIRFVNKSEISISEKMFLLSLNILSKNHLINLKDAASINDAANYKIKQLHHEISSWSNELHFSGDDLLNNFLALEMPVQEDILGVLYQSLLVEGEKAKKGSYYTPGKIIAGIVADFGATDKKVLDPCCGTGQFLLGFANVVKNPCLIYGTDIDPVAVKLAKLNLIMKYENIDFAPNIFLRDILSETDNKENAFKDFDVIATNPPWGFHFDKEGSERFILKNLFHIF